MAGLTAIVGDGSPEMAALRAPPAGIKQRRTGFIHEDAARTAQMIAHVVDDRHELETGAPDPVAQRPTVEVDPLPFEHPGLR